MTDTPSLRERLEKKKPRRLTVPIRLDNPEPLQDELQAVREARVAAQINGHVTHAELAQWQAKESELEQALADCVALVEFKALQPGEFEDLVAEHTVPDPDEGAVVDSASLLPVLAAYCAVDNSIRDVDWWVELLEGDAWTSAERSVLYRRLFIDLNTAVPSGLLGKG